MTKNKRFSAVFLCFFTHLAAVPALAAKTDIVTLVNGDRLTGEVVRLQRGLLEFKTDTMGTVQVEWDKIARVESNLLFEVERASGARHFGRLAPAAEPGALAIADAGGELTPIPVADTVRVTQMDQAGSFRSRLDGNIEFGFSYSDSTKVGQLSLGAEVTHRDRKRLWGVDLSVAESDSPETGSSGTASLGLETRRFFGNRWFWTGLGRFEQNDSLGVDLRTLIGGGGGRYLIQSTNQELSLLGGVVGTREEFADGHQISGSELLLGVDYDAFRFDSPELQVGTRLLVFPSLSISGRVRTHASISLRYEIIKDLFAGLSLNHVYDSEPQSLGAQSSDYSVTSSIGYKF